MQLADLNEAEWEALCDGCGKCCRHMFNGKRSDIACRLLDLSTGRCGNYVRRFQLVPSCRKVTLEYIEAFSDLMPETCAYRLLHEGKPLYDWHPLISGKPIPAEHSIVGMKLRTEAEAHEDDLNRWRQG